ncbi:hypothetical protein BGX27_011170 [Mortierella sp. AM989]|nr:hypothetical protein BGX27_011170 [Mortierella sp. AM989]
MLRANQTYSYDFSLALPVNLPNSLHRSTGKIEYLFSANGKRSTFSLDLITDRLVEIYQSLPPAHPHCIYPIQHAANFEGALNYLVQIPRKAFHHGSAIPIVVRMNSLPGIGARWHVKSMHVRIKEYFWFISPGKGVKEDKRTLVETVQGSGSWPVQATPVERTISISLPASNIMSTVDTEIIKCSHKLKIMFSIEVNGSSKKLATDFDLYVPGPFPPGQGPAGSAPVATPPQTQATQQQLQYHAHAPVPPQHTQPIQQHTQPIQQHTQPIQQHAHPIQQHAHPIQQHAQPIQQHIQPIQQHQPLYQQLGQPGQPGQQPYPLLPPPSQQQPAQQIQQYPPSSQQQQQQQQPAQQHQQPAQQHQQYPPLQAQKPVEHQQQLYQTQPYSASLPTPVISSTGYPPSVQTPTSFAQAPPFSQPGQQQINYPTLPASTPGSTPGLATAQATPHPYSQGYPTPTTSHSYPVATSSQGYPTPAMPPLPSPTAVSNQSYPMPPSPGQGYAQSQSSTAPSPGITYMSMPVPSIPTPSPKPTTPSLSSPNITNYAYSAPSPVPHPKTPVISQQQQQQQQQFPTSPSIDSSKAMTANGKVLQIDDSIKVDFNFDDKVKVSLEDIKIPSTPSTPSTPSRNHPKNPQQRGSYVKSLDGGSIGGDGSSTGGGVIQQEHHQIIGEANKNQTFVVVPPKPHAPHAIKETGDNADEFTYQPPPSMAATPVKAAETPKQRDSTLVTTMSSQQADLSHQFGLMGISSGPNLPPRSSSSSIPVTQTGATTTMVTSSITTSPSQNFIQPGVAAVSSSSSLMASPLNRTSGSIAANSTMYSSPLSPVSAAATGAVIASQGQQKQYQQQYQGAATTLVSMSQVSPAQVMQPQQKQQVWIPMYQSHDGKLYVKYMLGA